MNRWSGIFGPIDDDRLYDAGSSRSDVYVRLAVTSIPIALEIELTDHT